MALLFVQTRNGTISIVRDLTKEEADTARDLALRGPEKRAAEAAQHAFTEEMVQLSGDYFHTHQRAECFYHYNKKYNGTVQFNGEIKVFQNSSDTGENPYDVLRAEVF